MLENGAVSELVVITCSCLNSRTASGNARNVGPVDEIYEKNSDSYSQSRMPAGNDTRTSKDCTVNSFGRHLIGICEEFGLSVLNAKYLDFSGNYTYVSQTDCSLVDYFIIPTSMFSKFVCFNVLSMEESNCLAVEMFIVTETRK